MSISIKISKKQIVCKLQHQDVSCLLKNQEVIETINFSTQYKLQCLIKCLTGKNLNKINKDLLVDTWQKNNTLYISYTITQEALDSLVKKPTKHGIVVYQDEIDIYFSLQIDSKQFC